MDRHEEVFVVLRIDGVILFSMTASVLIYFLQGS